MKIGILTYHRSLNYGAFLQSVSLCNRLNQEEGIEAEIIDYDTEAANKEYSPDKWKLLRKIRHYDVYVFNKKMRRAFARGYEKTKSLRSNESIVSDNINEFQKFVDDKYDLIISGSDEIWNPYSFRGFPTAYFLIGDLNCRKFSYAASARVDFDKMQPDKHNILISALKDYEYISVRDRKTYESVLSEGISQERVCISCDPSFLYDYTVESKSVDAIIGGNRLDKNKKNIVVMCNDKRILRNIRCQLSKKYNLISVAIPAKGYISLPDIDPFEWLELLKNSDFVISTFFHGVCFSIMNGTPFVALAHNEHRGSKIKDLLENTVLSDHYVAYRENEVKWEQLIHDFSDCTSYGSFVLEKRKNFDEYIRRLKNE